MNICWIVFGLKKLDDILLCYVIFKKYFQNSGFIAATLYSNTLQNHLRLTEHFTES